MGPEIGKRQVLDLDLSGVPGAEVRIRLESVPSFWTIDRVALDFTPDAPLAVADLALLSARDRQGRDVRALVDSVDHRYYTMTPGDAAELQFRVPPLPAGVERAFLVRSNGWYRIHAPSIGDGDSAMLQLIARDSLGIAKASVDRLNRAVQAMARVAP